MLPSHMSASNKSVFVVNPRSGGRAGGQLVDALRTRLGADRVFTIGSVDLADLARQCHGMTPAMIACGGDGTVAALLDHAWQAAGTALPTPVGVWPLGTGNDLARHCGAPLSGAIESRLAWLESAVPHEFDRWELVGPIGKRAWFNYCSWGCDARITERFHRLRTLHPWAFTSPLTNKACYVGLGLQELGSDLALRLESDGGAEQLPTWMRSLVLANIPSYAGGQRLGEHIQANDGHCDAFALPSGLALGIGLSGIRRPRALGTHRHLALRLARTAFLQIDGEPLIARPGDYRIHQVGRVRLLMTR